jgi:guanidinoacetate N-methyltransferase
LTNFAKEKIKMNLPSQNESFFKEIPANFIGYENWKTAPANITEERLEIAGNAVMEAWEEPYMQELAKIVTSKGGAILEVGFGLGISAKYIQQYDIEHHTIVEANSDVFVKLEEFARQAKHKVTPILGFWQEVVDSLPSESFDGILFDTYPITKEELDKLSFQFVEAAYRLLKKGGVFTYFSDYPDFRPSFLQFLNEVGFSQVSATTCNIQFQGSKYWGKETPFDQLEFLAPIIIK